MRRSGEIIIVEDDEDDRLFLKDIFDSLEYPNKVVFFADPTEVIGYLFRSPGQAVYYFFRYKHAET